MSEVGFLEMNAEECQKLLAQLPGVFAAGIRMEAGRACEIHILASASRNAKQIARDVQSAIFAVYGVELDHRIISVAQLARDPSVSEGVGPAEEQSVRLLFSGMDSQRKDRAYSTKIHLTYNGGCFSGEAQCHDTFARRSRAVAQATLNAVHAFLGRNAFELLDVKQAEFGGESVVITVVEQYGADDAPILVGAVIQGSDISESIVRSTLDAVNRKIGMLYRSR